MIVQDSVGIVTGASMGIGEAVARHLGQAGAKVVLAARSGDRLEELAAQIPGSLAVPTDMRKPEEIRKLVNRTLEEYGRVDILINNAGQGMRAPVESIDIGDYQALIELNVFGPLIAMQEVIPLMRRQGGGMILNVSSMLTKMHMPQLAAYSSTKYALNSLSFAARKELEKDHIVVSVFNPKMTATDFGHNARGETYDSRAGRPGMTVDTADDVAREILKQLRSEAAEVQM